MDSVGFEPTASGLPRGTTTKPKPQLSLFNLQYWMDTRTWLFLWGFWGEPSKRMGAKGTVVQPASYKSSGLHIAI
jgi:hypothetical protein